MATTLNNRPRTPGGTGVTGIARLEIMAISALILGNLFMVSGLLAPWLEKDVAVSGAFQIAIILGYAAVSLRRGHIVPLAIAVLLSIYLVFQTILFSEISGEPANINAALTIFTLLMFIPLYETRLPLGLLLRILTIVAAGYVVLYLLLNGVILDLVKNDPRLVMETDGERDRRVFLAVPWALFVLFYGVFSLKNRPLPGIAAIVMSVAALFLANSRLVTVLAVPVLLAAIVGIYAPRSRKFAPWLFAAAFVLLSLIIMWGYADHNWNAYALIARDSSGTARFFEFQDAVTAIKGHELFGVGIAPSNIDLQYFIRPTRPFFVSDLGTAGVFFQFGLFGALLFIAWSVLCIVSFPHDGIRHTPASLALHYTTLHTAFVGFFAPNILGSIGVIFAAMVTALWLKGGFYSLGRISVYPPGIDPQLAVAGARPGRSD